MSTFRIADRVRPHFKSLIPYSSARHEFSGEAQIFLDANENPFENGYNRYPDPLQTKLKSVISSIRQIETHKIFVGNGSDEAIDLLIRLFCEPGRDHILTLTPTYGMYKVCATINNIPVIEIPLGENFSLPVEKILNQINEKTGIIFICSPNNPTGNAFSSEDILRVVDQSGTLVVVDEAYIDFSGEKSMIKELERPNLIVLQTLSKAFGLAGLRLGMTFSNAPNISLLNQIKPPYNISSAAQEEAIRRLENLELPKIISEIKTEREWLESKLFNLKIVHRVHPSDANFLLTEFKDAQTVFQFLKSKGIIVRDRSKETGCSNCLRITVGTTTENQSLIKTLKEIETK